MHYVTKVCEETIFFLNQPCVVDIQGKFVTQNDLLPWVSDTIIGTRLNHIEIDPKDAKFTKTERPLLLTQDIYVLCFSLEDFSNVSTTT